MKCIVFASIVLLGACDNSQAFHEPHPSLERMQSQERVNPFDARGMSRPPSDTISIESDPTPIATISGDDVPVEVDDVLLEEGRASFERTCATCHGVIGDGKSVMSTKMQQRPPPSLHDVLTGTHQHQHLFDVITHGYGLMPNFAHELSVRERWAVVLYVDALRLSRRAIVRDLPPDVLHELTSAGVSTR
jgi:mono/diheme cytochrome c family protein